jgi:hypothetical protein
MASFGRKVTPLQSVAAGSTVAQPTQTATLLSVAVLASRLETAPSGLQLSDLMLRTSPAAHVVTCLLVSVRLQALVTVVEVASTLVLVLAPCLTFVPVPHATPLLVLAFTLEQALS